MPRRFPALGSVPLLVLALLALAPLRPAGADAASAAAAMPDGPGPFLVVTMDVGDDVERAVRLPEYAVYGDGTLLVQKSDQRLWIGRLTRDQAIGILAFALDDVRLPSVDINYLTPWPGASWREYRLTTKTGTKVIRRRLG